MGGFEGGDEGGFWDVDSIQTLIDKQNSNAIKQAQTNKPKIQITNSIYSIKSHAKLTIFLKITGYKNGYPTVLSRLMRLESLYDTISFVPCECDDFSIEGCDNIDTETNSIFKAYQALCEYTNDSDIVDFFNEHKVVVTKRITSGVGLGASASNAAAFIHLLKEACNLILSIDELLTIGKKLSPELAFFIHNYDSANVSGFSDVIEPFDEKPLRFEIHTSNIQYDTALLYKTFKEKYAENISLSSFSSWVELDSKSILELNLNPLILNDLYAAAITAYPDIKESSEEGWFLSGSSFFKQRSL